ncbi:MAG: hypothetical protein WDN06_22665 [Asticcacaulis sp.]
MRIAQRHFPVAGIDDDKGFRRREQAAHVPVENVVLDEVIDDVQRHRKVAAFRRRALVDDTKGLVGIGAEQVRAHPDGDIADIIADISGIARITQLVAVAAPEFDDLRHLVQFDKAIEELRLEFGQRAVGALAAVAARLVTLAPVGV